MPSDCIEFYHRDGPYGEFSNFYDRPITFHGRTWPTSEHAFQAMKFALTDIKWAKQIAKAPGPGTAARMGRDRAHRIHPKWDSSLRDDVMRAIVLAKFSQHEDLREVLLATGDAILVEHTTNDSYWADGGDGSGKNRLGRILMEVRKCLRDEDPSYRARVNWWRDGWSNDLFGKG